MIDPQKLIDTINKAIQDVRSDYHLTLGELIAALQSASAIASVRWDGDSKLGPGTPESYRGYYSDLAFPDATPPTVRELLSRCEAALGCEYEGYKGGKYRMDENTPLWRSEYGEASGTAIVGVDVGLSVRLITRQID